VDFKLKFLPVGDKRIKLTIWDTGAPRLNFVAWHCYSLKLNAHAPLHPRC
jgi:hypothetical protein